MKVKDLSDDAELKGKGKREHCGYVPENEMVLGATESCSLTGPKTGRREGTIWRQHETISMVGFYG
jgi:hypothetical protein